MLIYLLITFVTAITARIAANFTSTMMGMIINEICACLFISAFIATIINLIMRSWVRFYLNIYKDESYLTNTLPVKKSTIYNAKIISFILSILFNFFILTICFLIFYLNDTSIITLKELFSSYEKTILVILICILVLLEIFNIIVCGINGIIIGNRSNNHKVLKAIFIGVCIYWLISILILFIFYIISLFNNNISALFSYDGVYNFNSFKSLMYISIIIYIIIDLILYNIGKNILNKGVNIE
jgi:hypothetical protein